MTCSRRTTVSHRNRDGRYIRYEKKNALQKTPCAPTIMRRVKSFGFLIAIKVMRCILSFSASSRRVSIHRPSFSIFRRDRKCRSIPPTIPGTPATVSRKIIRNIQSFSVIWTGFGAFSTVTSFFPFARSINQNQQGCEYTIGVLISTEEIESCTEEFNRCERNVFTKRTCLVMANLILVCI